MKTKTVKILSSYCALLLFVLCHSAATGQQRPQPIHFKNGILNRESNIARITGDSLHLAHFRKSYYVLLQFDHLPGSLERAGLQARGVRLFDYISGGSYLAEVPDDLPPATLLPFAVKGIYKIPTSIKLSPRLADNPEEYTQQEGQLIA
ncbi:MAG TPA: hypothetical protein VHC50_11030, partial [Puia sp.]|nr:hypothetical protein [Puia sp.]